MTLKEKISILERLVRRGEVECAVVCCLDWGLRFYELENLLKLKENT